MKLTGTRDITAAPDAVWTAILDPEVLCACIPGCESLTGSAEAGYEAVVKQKVGPVSATFTGVVSLSDVVAGRSVRISGEGKGGVAGYARGGANVTLEPIAGGTRLSYDVDASVGGKIAQLGSRIIDAFAKRLADDFFARFQARFPGEATMETNTPPVTETEVVAKAGEAKKGWFKRLIGA